MDLSPPSSSSSPSDLRRSKRNKFHLDVTTMHLINPERSRKHASSASPLPRENRDDKGVPPPPTLSPQIAKKRKLSPLEESIDEKEERKEIVVKEEIGVTTPIVVQKSSPKKPKSASGRDRNKPHICKICPASFDSTISLDLHSSLHGANKKHKCVHCNYSSNSLHAVRTHIRMHSAYLSSLLIGNRSSSSASPSSFTHSTTSISSTSIDAINHPLSIAITQDDISSNEGIDDEEDETSSIPFLPSAISGTSNGTRMQTTFNGKYKCPTCPFITKDNERLDKHLFGHVREAGFACPLCTFKSDSSGFLKRHVEIHGVSEYTWPPLFVGIIEKKEKEGSPISIGKVLKAAHNASIPRDKIGETVSALQSERSSPPTPPPSLVRMRPSSSSSHLSSLIENGDGIERGNHPISTPKEKGKKGGARGWRKGTNLKCRETDCTHNTKSRARAVIHRIQNHWKKKVVSGRLCGECGMRLNGDGAKIIHWEKNHRDVKWSRRTIKRYADERCGVKNPMDETPMLIREKYGCDECPYSSPVRSKLERHQNKHVLKEDFNCKFCSFSCRNDELLQSHQRTHYYRLVERSEMERGGGVPSTPTPTCEYRIDSDSPPALERAESSMGESDEMPVLESVGAPPILEMEIEMKEEKGKKGGKGAKKKQNGRMQEDSVEKRAVEQLRLIEKAVRIRNLGVIGIKRIGGEMSRRYKCMFCPCTMPFISTLWAHSRHHLFTSSPSSSLHHCPDCTFTTSLLPTLSDHISMHVRARETFPCEFCPFVGKTSCSLDEHIEWTGHGIPSIPSLPSRDSPVDDPSNLQMGRLGDKPISFNLISSKKWMKPSNEEKKLLRLMNKAKYSRDHQCPECPFSDSDQVIYNLHKRMHEGPKQPFECNVCSYSVATAEGLHHHISLHIPPDTAPLKRSSIRRRNSCEMIPSGIPSFDCTACTFRTLEKAAFHAHKLEHAQLIQQRLVTQIKRAATTEDETRKKNKMRPITTKSMKQLPCHKCDFVCETAAALIRHRECHDSKGPFECHICDYAATTKQITDFHLMHHHTKMPMANLRKQAILMPESTKMKVSSTLEEKVQLAGQIFLCEECDTQFLEMRQLLRHWEEDHSRRGDDTAIHLSLGMLPTNRVLTKA